MPTLDFQRYEDQYNKKHPNNQHHYKTKGWSLWGDIGQALGFDNKNSTSSQQKAAAERTRNFNSIEAKKLRKWQEDLANNAIQRRMADYKKAGINPILVAQYGGADVPGGAAASSGMEQIQTPLSAIGNIVGSVAASRGVSKGLKHSGNQRALDRAHQKTENQLNRDLHLKRLKGNSRSLSKMRRQGVYN